MSLPTAHNYIIENIMEDLASVEKYFLKPKVLMQLLAKTEEALIEGAGILSKKEFALKYFKKLKVNPSYLSIKTNNNPKISFKRGKYLGLNIRKIEKKLNIKMPNSNKVINNLFYENFRN